MTSLFEDHLGLDAVVAFVDGEMGLTAFQRAAAHVARCDACAIEVAEQNSARQQLRSAAAPRIPSGLLDALRSIPVAAPVATPAAASAESAEAAPHPAAARGRGFRLGAGAVVAGLAVGALAATGVSEHSTDPVGPLARTTAAQVGNPLPPQPVITFAQVAHRLGR